MMEDAARMYAEAESAIEQAKQAKTNDRDEERSSLMPNLQHPACAVQTEKLDRMQCFDRHGDFRVTSDQQAAILQREPTDFYLSLQADLFTLVVHNLVDHGS